MLAVTRNLLALTSLSYRVCLCLRWTPRYKDVVQTRVVSNCKRKRSQEEKETDQYHRPSVASSTTAALEAGGVKKAPTEKLIPVKVETIDELVRMHKMYSATAKSLLKNRPVPLSSKEF